MKNPPQEPDAINGRAAFGAGIGTVVAIVVGIVVAYLLGNCRSRELGLAWIAPRVPRLTGDINAIETSQYDVEAQGLEDHRRAQEWLASYGWVDRDRRVIHVPVDVAFQLYLSRGKQ